MVKKRYPGTQIFDESEHLKILAPSEECNLRELQVQHVNDPPVSLQQFLIDYGPKRKVSPNMDLICVVFEYVLAGVATGKYYHLFYLRKGGLGYGTGNVFNVPLQTCSNSEIRTISLSAYNFLRKK